MFCKAFDCMMWNIYLLRKNIRLYLCVILGICICFFLSERIVFLANQFEVSVQLFEPFIWCFSEGDNILFSSFALILVLTQMPRLDGSAAQLMLKKGKTAWLLGQILTVFVLSTIYSLFILACTILIAGNTTYFANTWSNLATILSYDSDGFESAIKFTRRTIKLTLPFQGGITIFFLFLQYNLFLSLLHLTVSLKWSKKVGMCALVLVSAWGFLINPQRIGEFLKLPLEAMYYANAFTVWLSPLQQAAYPMHNFGYDLLPTITQSHLIFTGINLILMLLSYFTMKGEIGFE